MPRKFLSAIFCFSFLASLASAQTVTHDLGVIGRENDEFRFVETFDVLFDDFGNVDFSPPMQFGLLNSNGDLIDSSFVSVDSELERRLSPGEYFLDFGDLSGIENVYPAFELSLEVQANSQSVSFLFAFPPFPSGPTLVRFVVGGPELDVVFDLGVAGYDNEVVGFDLNVQNDNYFVDVPFSLVDSNRVEIDDSSNNPFNELPSGEYFLHFESPDRGNPYDVMDVSVNSSIDAFAAFSAPLGYVSIRLEIAPFLVGDINLDGIVNFLDIAPFISLLSGGGFQSQADLNQDGLVNFLDIGGFIGVLSTN